MTLVGILMVFISLRAQPEEIEKRGIGIIFIGPLPIIIGGSRKWIITALVIASLIILVLVAKSFQPNLIGW
jgi:uncharacterized membrane protein